MQIVSIVDNVHEMSNPVSWKKKKQKEENPADEKLMIHVVFLFFSRISCKLSQMLNPVSEKKYFKMLPDENFTESAKF